MKDKNRLALLAILIILYVSSFASEASDYYFTYVNSENGLSQCHVKSILQDSRGFLWFGTQNGLNRYDGISMRLFDCYDKKQKRGNQVISALYEDSDSCLWVGTDDGIYIYNPSKENFSFFDVQTDDGVLIAEQWIEDIISDKNGNIWIMAPNLGLFRYDKQDKGLHHYFSRITNNKSKDYPHCLTVDKKNQVWVGTNGSGIFLYNPAKDKFVQCSDSLGNISLQNEFVFTLCDYNDELIVGSYDGQLIKFDKQIHLVRPFDAVDVHYKIIRCITRFGNDIWVGTQNGVYILNESNKTETHIPGNTLALDGLSDNIIEKIYKDKEGGIWIGTNFGGANYLPNHSINFNKYLPTGKQGSINGRRISELGVDGKGNIWVGTQDGGVNKFDPATGLFSQPNLKQERKNVLSLYADKDEIGIGYFQGGIDVFDKDGKVRTYSSSQLHLDEGSPFAFYRDSNGNIWLGDGWSIFRSMDNGDTFHRMSQFGYAFMQDILEDDKGRIWVATMGNGVFCYDPVMDKIKNYMPDTNDSTSISTKEITGISKDAKGNLWFSTDRGGICYYAVDKDYFITFSVKDGLPDNVSYRALEDNDGYIWFGTNKGLIRLNPENRDIRVFTKQDGLPDNQFSYKSAVKGNDGTFWFGTINGLISFNPYQIKRNTFVPPVFITNLSIFNREMKVGEPDSPLKKSITMTENIVLPYNRSNISFDFVALSFTSPKANRYAYKMEGIDKEWIYTDETHTASYAKLPPGHYVFCVKASNNDGVWNENEQTISIDILPPWWKTWWAYLLYIVVLIGVFYSWFRNYKRKQEHKAKEKQNLFEIAKEKELYRAKVDFFTQITHEIRTPLTLINGPLEALCEMDVRDSGIRRNLQVMKQNTNRLLTLINQLLDFRKVNSNKFLMIFTMIDVNKLLLDTKERFEPLITQQHKDIKLSFPNVTVVAAVDKDGLIKIISNLFNNALKYSESVILVDLQVEATTFTLRISNDGKLVPVHLRHKIFEPFFRIDCNKENSSGLGLPLVKSLAELHNGEIHFEEVNGLNSFVLTLPLNQECVIKLEPESVGDKKDDENILLAKSSYTLLVVEDNDDMRNFIAERLLPYYAVEMAINGEEGLLVLENKRIDLIISDVMMPVMDGLELCRHVKSVLDYSHIPVILLTAKNDLESKIKGLEQGADAYLDKPFSFRYLLTQISTLLRNREKEREAFARRPFFPINNLEMSKADKQFLNHCIELIEANLADPEFNVEKMSDLICMSRSNLHRKIKALSGMSSIDFIRTIKLKRAAELIQEGEHSIGEISEMIGIQSAAYFSKIFQKQFGITPKDFAMQTRFAKEN